MRTSITPRASASADIEFWFDFSSVYSYPSVMRIDGLAASHGLVVRWRPFLLGPVFKALGWETSPFLLQKQKGDYMWQDIARQCEKYGLPWQQPSIFPRRALLPMRIALLGEGQSWMAPFCQEVMRRCFVLDEAVDDRTTMDALLSGLGLPAPALLQDAETEENKTALRMRTEMAKEKGIFGAPTFFVGDEMFWGDDRLDDAVRYAASARSS